MNERWRVQKGTWGAWRVYRGDELVTVFGNWRRAFLYARQEAIYESWGIVSVEITS